MIYDNDYLNDITYLLLLRRKKNWMGNRANQSYWIRGSFQKIG